MEFIRQNLFLVILLGATVAGAGILLALNAGVAGDIEDELIPQRNKVTSGIQGTRRKAVNQDVVAAKARQVAAVRAAAGEVDRKLADWNRRDYPVLMLKTPAGQQVPAFPIDEKVYRAGLLRLEFPAVYRRELQTRMDALKPAVLPTVEERDQLRKNEESLLQLRAKQEAERAAATAPAAPVKPTPHAPAWGAPGMESEPGFGPAAGMPGVIRDVSAEAARIADEKLQIKTARSGTLYVSEAALDWYFPPRVPSDPRDDQLWQAQLNLWVTSDILAVVDETNQQVFRVSQREANVLNAAVKRLVSVDIDERYYTGGGESVRTAGTAAPAAAPVTVFGPSPTGGYGGETSYGPTAGTAADPPVGLTLRVCNPLRDILHYRFTVIMPTRHLPRLLDNLEKRNLHTVRYVSIQAIPTETRQSGVAAGGAAAPIDPALYHYYGADPVLQVTVAGELQLLTAWERGTWDAQANAWSKDYPPLMPKAVLDSLRQRLASAMRNNDDSQPR
ncbi:MAG TPA: hypothetical protein DCX07_10275 [Phycisphaerales bacterium]|nr:hypothetical protein [Phycisphaerales bacterium]